MRAPPLRQFRRARQSKLAQTRRVPGSSVSIGRSCRNFACWLPKIGLLLGIFHAPRTENAPYGYERFGAPSENPPYGYARKKKKPSTNDGQLFIKVALRSNVLYRFFFATGSPLRLRSRPPDSGFAGVLPRHCRHVIHAHLLGFWKLRNFLRPINASMKEATAKRHLPVWIGLRLVLCPVPPPTSQSFVLGHGTCAGQRRL